MVLGRKQQWHSPLNFHGSGANLKSIYKRTNEDLERKVKERNNNILSDGLNFNDSEDKEDNLKPKKQNLATAASLNTYYMKT